MALTDPDEIVERLTQRKEIQTSLKDVTTLEDLEKVLEDNLEGGSEKIKVRGSDGWFTTTKEHSKQNLKDMKGDLFETRKIEIEIINNVDRLDDLDRIQRVIIKNPIVSLQAKQRGKEVSKKLFDVGNRAEFERAIQYLRDNDPRYLGYLKGIKTYQDKAKGFKLIFG